MSLINSKYMERHRLMLKESRMALTQQNSQLFQYREYENSLKTFEDNSYNCETNESFVDEITFGHFLFTYDREFLNKLRQLTQELRISFSTEESRNKSRTEALNIDRFLDSVKNDLIERIKNKIKDIDGTPDDEQDISSQKSSINTNKSEDSNKRVKKLCRHRPSGDSNRESNKECESGLDLTEKSCEYTINPVLSLYTQQYIQSLNVCENEFRFSDENYRILSPSEVSATESGIDACLCTQSMESQTEDRIESQMDSQLVSKKSSQTTESQTTRGIARKVQIINRHKWENTEYHISTGITLKANATNKVRVQRKRKIQLKFVLQKILKLIDEDVFCTKRDLYYQNVDLFDKSQRVVDEIIDDLASSLRVSRTKLRIVSSTRGLVFGHLSFQNTNGVLTDCLSSPNGINIPNDTEKIASMTSNALFVLIIEKDATFQQFIDLNVHLKYPLIMITGHGYPDLNTRAFVQMLWNTFEIPIFGLVDGDPNGLEILCTFRHGSLALSYESSNLVAPVIRWLGVFPTDILKYNLNSSLIDLTEKDRKKIQDLKNRVYLKGNKEWTKQLEIMLKMGKKVEIQSLAEHWPTFLLDTYLPGKLRYGQWI